jgi:hypothetical protein
MRLRAAESPKLVGKGIGESNSTVYFLVMQVIGGPKEIGCAVSWAPGRLGAAVIFSMFCRVRPIFGRHEPQGFSRLASVFIETSTGDEEWVLDGKCISSL